MDENHRDRPSVETFLLILCMVCPGVLLAGWYHLHDIAGGWVAGWFKPYVGIPLLLLILAGCCWVAGWILESGIDEERRVGESIDTGLLLLVFQFILTPMIAFAASILFDVLKQKRHLPALLPPAFLTP